MIKVLLPNSLRDTKNLCEMHQLRYIKFVQELGWKDGLYGVNQMEFDCFDHEHAFYLVHTNGNDQVDTVARLTQTTYPNLLFDAFSENIRDLTETIRSCRTLEISRFCSNPNSAPRNVMGQIIGGLLEIGLAYNIKNYVSFSNIYIKPRANRFGWPLQEIGPIVNIDNEKAVALNHNVTKEYYNKVMNNLGFEKSILTNEEIERCPIKCIRLAL